MKCTCGHPQGWHRRGAGSCLECACVLYVSRASAVAALPVRAFDRMLRWAFRL